MSLHLESVLLLYMTTIYDHLLQAVKEQSIYLGVSFMLIQAELNEK